MTNEEARTIQVPLGFLGEGKWQANVFGDGARAQEPRLTKVDISTREVNAAAILTVVMQPSGGQAILFERVT